MLYVGLEPFCYSLTTLFLNDPDCDPVWIELRLVKACGPILAKPWTRTSFICSHIDYFYISYGSGNCYRK